MGGMNHPRPDLSMPDGDRNHIAVIPGRALRANPESRGDTLLADSGSAREERASRNDNIKLMALAAAAFERDNWSPCGPRRDRLRQVGPRFRQLFGNSEQMLAALHFAPDIFRAHAGGGPQHG